MANAKRSLILGLVGGVVYFLFSFAKTVLVVPVMLSLWGVELFNYWLLLNSGKIFFQFIPEGYIRYVANSYNIRFHGNKHAAIDELNNSTAFLLVAYVVFMAIFVVAFALLPSVTAFVFNTDRPTVVNNHIGWSIVLFLAATSIQNVTRLNYAKKEPLGRNWENLLYESLLLCVEIVVIMLLVWRGHTFLQVVAADSLIIAVISLYYYARTNATTRGTRLRVQGQTLKEGWHTFAKSTWFNLSNFFDKLTNESFILLLSFFKFGHSATTLYSTVRTVTNAPVTANMILVNAILPELQKGYSQRNTAHIQQLLLAIWLGIGTVLCIGVVSFYPFYEQLFLLWTTGKIAFSYWFFTLILIDTLIIIYGSSLMIFLKGVNHIKRTLSASVIRAICIVAAIAILPKTLLWVAYILIAADATANIGLYAYHSHRVLKGLGSFSWLPLLAGLIPYILSIFFLLLFNISGYGLGWHGLYLLTLLAALAAVIMGPLKGKIGMGNTLLTVLRRKPL